MLSLKKILCPTDFSDPSMKALKVAVEWAETFSAELLILHVIAPVPVVTAPPAPTAFDIGLYRKELEKAANQSLKDIVENKISADITVKPMVLQGQAPDEIVKAAEENNVDLIVTSTHGTTGWRHLVFGSVAEKVVRSSTCPVLSIQVPSDQ